MSYTKKLINTFNKKKWRKSTIITISNEELKNHIKAAARSSIDCLGSVGR